MALKTCLLTDADCRNAKPPTYSGKRALKDGGSLFLVLMSYGGKLWQYRYRFHGKANIFSIGAYPEVSLKEARKRRDEARELLDQGIDQNSSKIKYLDSVLSRTFCFGVAPGLLFRKPAPCSSRPSQYNLPHQIPRITACLEPIRK